MAGRTDTKGRPEEHAGWRDILAMVLALYQLVLLPFAVVIGLAALVMWALLLLFQR